MPLVNAMQDIFGDILEEMSQAAPQEAPKKEEPEVQQAVKQAVKQAATQVKPSISHKMEVLDAFANRTVSAKKWLEIARPSHVTCCNLTTDKLSEWKTARVAQKWDLMPEELRQSWRVPSQWRTTQLGLAAYG